MSDLYNLPNASHRGHFYDRAAESVRNKICKVYHLAPQSFAIPFEIRKTITRPLTGAMMYSGSDSWLNKCISAVAASDLPPDTINQVDAAARGILERYFEAFYLREQLSAVHANSTRYPEPATRHSFGDLYLNHRCNQAEAQLEALGLTQEIAHGLNGTLIGMAVQAYGAHDKGEFSYMKPMLGGSRDRTPEQMGMRIKELRKFHTTPQRRLEKNYEKGGPTSYER